MARRPKGAKRHKTVRKSPLSSSTRYRPNARVELRFEEATRAYHRGDLQEAAATLLTIVEKTPHPGALHLLGHLHHGRGDLSSALGYLQRAVEAAPKFGEGHAALGVVYQQLGRIDDAVDAYQEAIASAPQDSRNHYNLGSAYKLAHNLEAAARAYKKAAELSPEDLSIAGSLGRTLIELGELTDAADVYRDAMALAPPGQPDINEPFVFCAMRCGYKAEALAAAEALQTHHPNHLGGLVLGTSANLALGQSEAARDACIDILSRIPNETQTLANLALAAHEIGDDSTHHNLYDFERFLDIQDLPTPAGFESIEALNRALLAHINAHPTLRFEQHSLSCHRGATSDELLVPPLGPVQAWETMIRGQIEQYIANLDLHDGHPFATHRPHECELSAWATVLQGQGHQGAHIHPSSWLSGVYYVSLPDVMRHSDHNEGWIEFGRAPAHYSVTREAA
ncbi:MAG: tetratricopeptide repeat protein, partial [Gammaproteobacteria bacterium]|nr:tetratricopeptide repeat protein [Gammaproteobacteria bacterium]